MVVFFVSGLEKGYVHLTSGACNMERALLESPKLEFLTSATQAADHDDMFLARSGKAVLHIWEVLAS